MIVLAEAENVVVRTTVLDRVLAATANVVHHMIVLAEAENVVVRTTVLVAAVNAAVHTIALVAAVNVVHLTTVQARS
jgi:hypothetical protein